MTTRARLLRLEAFMSGLRGGECCEVGSLFASTGLADTGPNDNIRQDRAMYNQAMNEPAATRRLAVVAFDRISPFHLSVPCLVFDNRESESDRDTDLPQFDLRVCAAEPGRLRTRAGFSIETRYGLQALRSADTV